MHLAMCAVHGWGHGRMRMCAMRAGTPTLKAFDPVERARSANERATMTALRCGRVAIMSECAHSMAYQDSQEA